MIACRRNESLTSDIGKSKALSLPKISATSSFDSMSLAKHNGILNIIDSDSLKEYDIGSTKNDEASSLEPAPFTPTLSYRQAKRCQSDIKRKRFNTNENNYLEKEY